MSINLDCKNNPSQINNLEGESESSAVLRGRNLSAHGDHEKAEFLRDKVKELGALPYFTGSMEKTSLSTKVEKTKSYLEDVVREEHFTGVVMIAQGEKILLHEAYGMAREGVKNTTQTVFHVGSVTKQFTAAAIMKLKEKGKIRLDDPINCYLPEELRSEIWKGVTVRHLLTHTSGIADYTELRSWEDEGNGFCFKEVEGMIKASQAKGLEFPPGSDMRYRNLGYTLLGCVIKNVSEMGFDEYVQDRILNPLGMSSSGIHPKEYTSLPGHATGHRWDEESKKIVKDDEPSLTVTVSDGGLYTTSRDLLKWTRALIGKTPGVLSPQSIDLMLDPTAVSKPTRPNNSGGYGYGIGVDDTSGRRRIHHNGGIPGFRANVCVYPDEDLHIFILCNNTHAAPEAISPQIEKIFLE